MPITNFVATETSLVSTPAPPKNYLQIACFIPPVSEPPPFAEDAKEYASLDAMLDDGFLATDAAYLNALQYVGQGAFNGGENPTRWVVLKRAAAVAQVMEFEVQNSADGLWELFISDIGGTPVQAASFAAVASTTTLIKDGLLASLALGPFLGVVTGASVDPDSGSVTADVAGVPFVLTGTGPAGAADIVISTTTPNSGVYEDLGAGFIAAPFWDVLPDASIDWGTQREVSRWAEDAKTTKDRRNVCSLQTTDSTIVTATPGNEAEQLVALARTRSFPVLHVNTGDKMNAAWDGRYLGRTIGQRAWHFGLLGGSSVADTSLVYTEAEGAILIAQRVSWVERDGPALTRPLRIFWGLGSGGFFKVQKHAEDRWWWETQNAVVSVLESQTGANLDEEGISKVVAKIDEVNIGLDQDGVIDIGRTTVTPVPLSEVPKSELELGDYGTTGGIRVDTVLIPKLRSITTSAFFALS